MTESGTYGAQYSWEATTLDYLAPRWYDFEETFATKEEAEAFVAAKYAADNATFAATGSVEPKAYRTKYVRSQAEVDVFLEAEFAANRQYWAGRAAQAEAAQAAERAMYAMKGQQVVVVKGRKVPVGTTGECFWVGEGKYGWRVGFKDASGEVFWTAISNVETVSEEAVSA